MTRETIAVKAMVYVTGAMVPGFNTAQCNGNQAWRGAPVNPRASMSGPIARNDTHSRLSMLDELVARNDTTLRVGKDGGIETGGMTLRSGLHRLFGQEKSEQDIRSNQETLKVVLDYIKREAGEDIYKEVLGGKTRLSGDSRDYTVAERLERGTYVSSKLVDELRQLTHQAIEKRESQEQVVEERMTQHEPKNGQLIDDFLGRSSDPGKSPLQKVIQDMSRQGVPGCPPGDGKVWQELKEQFGAPSGKGLPRLVGELETRLWALAEKRAREGEGRALTNDDIRQETQECLRTQFLPDIVRTTNQKIIDNLSVDDVMLAVVEWPESQPDLHGDDKHSLRSEAKDLARELRQGGTLFEKLRTCIREEHEREEETFLGFDHHGQYQSRDLARLMGNELRDLIEERWRRL
jgi:hypothetical protein